jgi:hypothetical protein
MPLDHEGESREQHRQTLQLISAAQARGQARTNQTNQQVADNLERIMSALQTDDNTGWCRSRARR